MKVERRLSLAALTALTALLAAGPAARAQEVGTSLPLTSVGDRLMWAVGDQTLDLDVTVGGRLRLDLYSPRLDPADYRGDTYYGDETYGGEPGSLSTTFTLLDAGSRVVVRRTFAPGAHAWEPLLDGDLPAGRYRLNAQTTGNGKNTFAVRLTGLGAEMGAERLTVNLHARDWVPALNVTTDGQAPSVVRMYDGDGPGELEARVRDEAGRVTPLAVSGDLAWADLPLPRAAGRYVVELRQSGGARQYSNTVGFSLLRAGAATPLTLTRVDQTGQVRVRAELVLPGGTRPTAADVTLGRETLRVDGSLIRRVPTGDYPLGAPAVPGADVALDPPAVRVTKGGLAEARVQVRPQVTLSLQADKTEVCLGDTVTLTARVSTAFAGELPLDLTLDTPGLTLTGPVTRAGSFSAAHPGELSVTGTATAAGPLTLSARLAPWGQSRSVRVRVLPQATSLHLARAPLPDARVGDEVTVGLTVTNTAREPLPFVLTDTPGAGLEALDRPTFEGTLAPGESRTLSYRARVTAPGPAPLSAWLGSPGCAAPQTVAGTLVAAAPTPPAPVPPVVSRESTVSLPFRAPVRAGELVIAQQLPAGATLVPGSSRLDGQPLPDPLRGPSGTLYWVLPVAQSSEQRGRLTYDLAHTDALGALPAPALLSRPDGGRGEVLEGTLDPADLSAAKPLASAPPDTENAGAIKLPLSSSLLRTRDRVSVVVEAPLGPIPPLTVNGQPVSEASIGTSTQDAARSVQRLTFVGVPLRPGPNVLRFLNDSVTVQVVGATAQVQVVPVQLLADGSTPLRLRLRALDAFGNPSALSSVTLRPNLEPRTPDADPGEAGYQVRLQDGEGVLELQPQSSPTTLHLEVVSGDAVERHTFEVQPDASRVGVGVLSATLGLGGEASLPERLTWQARGSYEGPLAGGKVYAAADTGGLPTDENTLIRNPVAGDASTEAVPLQGIDPVALLYDHPGFRVQYRRAAPPLDVLPVGEQFTALSVASKGNPGVSAFVAGVPRDRVTDLPLTPEGTRLLRLPNANIAEGSETLVLVTLERKTGKELARVTLIRNVDYVLDSVTGIVTLTRALDPVDENLNRLEVRASYRLLNAEDGRQLAFGAQAKLTGPRSSVGVAAVSLDNRLTYGVRATYDDGTVRADARLAASGGMQGGADLSARLGDDTLSAHVRFQDADYGGLNSGEVGTRASASYTARLGSRLGGVLDGEYHNVAAGEGGSVGARAETRQGAFTVGAGLRYAFGDTFGLGAVGSFGYHRDPLDVDVVHTQPLSGNLDPTTTLTAKFRVTDKVSLGLADAVTWGAGDGEGTTHAAVLTLDSRLGNVNYAVGYELPGASGAGNRARFGVNTALPLGERVSLGLRGSAVYDLGRQEALLGAGADLTYRGDTVTAAAGTDLTLNGGQFGVVVRGGITGNVTPDLTLTADALAEFGVRSGLRASLGYAYRTGTLNSLGYARYRQGSLAGDQAELSAGASGELHRPNWALRAGLDTRTLLNDPDSFTLQAQAGGTYFLNSRFGVGAWGRTLTQPAAGSTVLGYGLEASVRALPGTWLTAGYNFKGFEGLPSAGMYTKPGLYLRLDLTLDDGARGERK